MQTDTGQGPGAGEILIEHPRPAPGVIYVGAIPALEVLTKQVVDTSDGTTIEEVTNDYDASRSAPEPNLNLNNAPSSPSPESPGRKPLDSNRSIHSVGRHRQSSASRERKTCHLHDKSSARSPLSGCPNIDSPST